MDRERGPGSREQHRDEKMAGKRVMSCAVLATSPCGVVNLKENTGKGRRRAKNTEWREKERDGKLIKL